MLNPSKKEFKRIMDANRRVGSAEGGDQGVFNNGVCPEWFTADHDDKQCGRLPWIYNVEVAHYAQYSTTRSLCDPLRERWQAVACVDDGIYVRGGTGADP